MNNSRPFVPRWQLRLVALGLSLALTPTLASGHRLLAVFAHPDDEVTVATALARYAAEGHDVYLAVITSGQIGGSRTDIPIGDELGRAREAETRCSTRALGIHEPLLLGFLDGSISDREVALPGILEELRRIVREIEPDVIVTFGPEGWYGHPDHRTAGTVASEIFQEPYAEGEYRPQKLYHAALPESRLLAVPGSRFDRFSAVRDELITTVVDGSDYLDNLRAAIDCHVTQFGPAERRAELFRQSKEVLQGKVYFRLAMSLRPADAAESSLFDGLVERRTESQP